MRLPTPMRTTLAMDLEESFMTKDLLIETLRRHGELDDACGICDCGWAGTDHAEHLAEIIENAGLLS